MPSKRIESGSKKLALSLRDVSVSLGSTQVLKDVDLSLEKGDFLGIIGPNGGGKTTLLKVILDLLEPERGEVKVLGGSPSKNRKKVGYVPQYTNFDAQFPIDVWNVVLMGRLEKPGWKLFYSKRDKNIAERALRSVNMYEYRDRQISNLSSGQQQRVLIARALATEPELLLLDEPTASVDEKIKTSVYDLLEKLNKEKNLTIVLVSHDIGVLSSHVKKVGCLNTRFIYHGTDELTMDMMEEAYECPVDIIAHGHPHRVFENRMSSEEE